MRALRESPAIAPAGQASVRVCPNTRAPLPRLAARRTPRARPEAAMSSRMGAWGGVRSPRPAQRWRRAVMVQAASKSFLQFEEARNIVREVGLKRKEEWQQWCRDGHRPADIPSAPHEKYKDKGWVSWTDWLGYGNRRLLPFEEARELVREAGLTSQKQWKQWCRHGHRPANVPSAPHEKYKGKGWLSWADWLGYGEGRAPKAPKGTSFLPFEEARAVVREARLDSTTQWKQWCRHGHRPQNVPFHPDKKYANDGWVSWPDWLGCNKET